MTGAWLQANGVDIASMALDQVRLYNLGQESAIYVYDLNENNQLDAADTIEFYGQPVTSDYAKYTDTNIYWLTDSGTTGALRMGNIDSTPGVAQLSNTHTATVRYEEDMEYFNLVAGADARDRWFSPSFVVGAGFGYGVISADFTLTLPDVGGQGTLTFSMWGSYDTDHEVNVSLNGAYLETLTWSGIASYETTIDPVNLLSGNNAITLTPVSGADPQDLDFMIVDWIEAVYPKGFTTTNDTLKFSHDEGFRHQVSGFTTDDLFAFDITSAEDVSRMIDFETTGAGPYTLEMEPQTGTGERTYMVLSAGETKTPAGISEDAGSSLADGENGADYILITHRDLGWDAIGDQETWLTDLVALREAQGLRVEVVDVADIYDEFSYGVFTPQAI